MGCTAPGPAAGMPDGPPGGAAGGWAENLLRHTFHLSASPSPPKCASHTAHTSIMSAKGTMACRNYWIRCM